MTKQHADGGAADSTADDLALTRDERSVLDLGWALSTWEIGTPLARRLGLADETELDWVVGLGERARAGGVLREQQWLLLIETIRLLADPDDTEWQTVTGFFFEQTVALLDSVEGKVRRRRS